MAKPITATRVELYFNVNGRRTVNAFDEEDASYSCSRASKRFLVECLKKALMLDSGLLVEGRKLMLNH